MSTERIVRPNLTVLDQEQIEQVHEYSAQLLSTTGVRVDSEQACRLFAEAAGCEALDGDRVRIPRTLIDWALEAAPPHVDIYDREGRMAFRLPGETRFGIGVTTLYYQNPETDQVTPFVRKHMESMVRLGNTLSSFDVISTVGIVQDVAPEVSDLYATLEMMANTTKPLVVLISDPKAFPAVLDLLEHLQGDLTSRPFVIPYLNPISPLVINKGTVDKMLVASERGLPFIYSNYGMAGASTPITPAGALAVLNAELLAGLVLSQLIKEGTPIILGSLPAWFDMKGMGSFYDPLSYVLDLACAEMMAYYRLPHAGTSGSGPGWGCDLIASGHQWMNHLVSCMGQVGLVPFVGDNLGSMTFSPAIVVYADEVIAQARRMAGGFVLNGEAVALDGIAQVGPGGNFLMADLTLELFRQAYFRSTIYPQLTFEVWQDRGRPRADDLLREHTRQLLDELAAPEDHALLMAQGEAFIARLGSDQQ